jgi:cell division protein ZapB
MSKIEELADRVERLLSRHGELQRTNALLQEQLAAVTRERDNLRSRLNAARHRIDMILERLPKDASERRSDGAATTPWADGAALDSAATDSMKPPVDPAGRLS